MKEGPLQSDYKKKSRSLAIMVEEMQAKAETVEERRESAPQLQSSARRVQSLGNLEELLADELTPHKADRKKVFIRSRL